MFLNFLKTVCAVTLGIFACIWVLCYLLCRAAQDAVTEACSKIRLRWAKLRGSRRPRKPLVRSRVHLDALRLVSGFQTDADRVFDGTNRNVDETTHVYIFGRQTDVKRGRYTLQCDVTIVDSSDFWVNGGKNISTRHVFQFSRWARDVRYNVEIKVTDMKNNSYGIIDSALDTRKRLHGRKRHEVLLLEDLFWRTASDDDLRMLVTELERLGEYQERPATAA